MSAYTTPEEQFGISTVGEAVEAVADSPRGITLLDGGPAETPLPYRLVSAVARRVATELARLGVEPGDRVALLSTTGARFLLCLYGVWRANAVPVILAPPHRLGDLERLMTDVRRRLDHVGARCVVVADSLAGFLGKRLGDRRPVLTCGQLAAARDDRPPALTALPDDLAYLQFTSGTTGPAKAVAISHRQLLTNAVVCCQRLMLEGERSVHASWAPLYHDLGLMTAVASISARTKLVLQSPEAFLASPDSWVDALSRHRATGTVTPNFAYGLAARSMRQHPRPLDLSALRVCGDGSEPTHAPVVAAFTEEGGRYGLPAEAVTPMYGLAEATLSVSMGSRSEPMAWDHVDRESLTNGGVATVAPPDAPGTRTLAVVGTAVPGVELAVVDEAGRPLPERHVGEVQVRGPSVMTGYWRDPEATAEVLRDGWLRTGDLGYTTPAGLVVCGRLKDLIIVGGANLYPEDYEYVAGQAEGAGGVCAAFALPEEERMVVAVEAAAGTDAAAAADLAKQVLAALRAELGHAPDRVVVTPRGAVPRTSSGKVQRARCRERYFGGTLPALAEVSR
ncbi:fatty-acyl-CoA synthase [Amycolatopsis sacchari]|uniref:Fatty-acyl-CoA synthase n=1 Tax=Amycolatopsis sacchari TaxID=115433 RepID=A0A1I3XC37_9PSEU|nr:AMP-binding protein [Amycolatopsis sacchari]SFK17135.1 fatty-acyl-CoA synthase [Amycolatopsis sacchari]